MAEARMIEMMAEAFTDAMSEDSSDDYNHAVRSGLRAALSVLAANVSDEMVEAFKDKMEPYTDGSGFNYKAALAAAIAAAGDEDRRA